MPEIARSPSAAHPQAQDYEEEGVSWDVEACCARNVVADKTWYRFPARDALQNRLSASPGQHGARLTILIDVTACLDRTQNVL